MILVIGTTLWSGSISKSNSFIIFETTIFSSFSAKFCPIQFRGPATQKQSKKEQTRRRKSDGSTSRERHILKRISFFCVVWTESFWFEGICFFPNRFISVKSPNSDVDSSSCQRRDNKLMSNIQSLTHIEYLLVFCILLFPFLHRDLLRRKGLGGTTDEIHKSLVACIPSSLSCHAR